jgi:acetyl esterase/lipase
MRKSAAKLQVIRKVSEVLSDDTRKFYDSIQEYRYVDAVSNPLTRALFRKISHGPWEKALEEIDFAYEAEDVRLGQVPCVKFSTGQSGKTDPVVMYVHGGGFIAGSAIINAATILPICHLTGYDAYSVDYSLAPEYKYPVQINELRDAYDALRRDAAPGRDIIVVADSAGCTLMLALLKQLQRDDVPLPTKAVFISPCLDGNAASDTMLTLSYTDPLLKNTGISSLKSIFRFYAGDEDVSAPEISPIYADMAGLPDMLIHVGSREGLLGDSARLSEKARQAKVPVTLRVFDGMFHLFHMHWSLPETKAAHEDIADFLKA